MPVDMSIPNSIIAAYLQGRRIREEAEGRQQNLLFHLEELKQQREQFEQTLEVSKERVDLANKLAESRLKTDHVRNQIAAAEAKNKGLLPSFRRDGKEYVPGAFFGPDHPDLEVLGPEEVSAQLAAQNKWKTDAAINQAVGIAEGTQPFKLEAEAFRSGNALENALKLQGARADDALALEAAKAATAEKLLGIKNANAIKLREMINAGAITREELKASLKESEVAEDFEAAIPQIESGNYTREDLQLIQAKARTPLMGTLSKMGIKPLSNLNVKEVQALASAQRLQKLVHEMDASIQKDGYGAQLSPEYRGKAAAFDSELTLLRRFTDDAGAFTNADRDFLAKKRPTTASPQPKSMSSQTVKEFDRFIDTRTNAILGRFIPRQRRALEKVYKLKPDPRTDPANF